MTQYIWQIITALIGSFILAFVANWLALIPWRRSRAAHWTEQARLLWPALASATSNIMVVPVVFYLGLKLIYKQQTLHWLPLIIVGLIGAILGNLPLNREVHAEYDSRKLLKELVAGWMLRLGIWLFFLGGVALMPDEFGWTILWVALFILLTYLWWVYGLALKLLEALKLLRPARPGLLRVVQEMSAKMQVQVKGVNLMDGPSAQAFAFPTTKRLLFSERLLQICDDAELSAICAHELAHLTESRTTATGRVLGSLWFFPWLFINPAIHLLSGFGLLPISLAMLAIIRLSRRLSLRMEKRADAIAKQNELDDGVYARALEKIHRENFIPAVASSDNQTHPHLYDRLLAAGFVPEYPRPKASKKQAWTGTVMSMLLGMLVVITFTAETPGHKRRAVADEPEQSLNSLPESASQPQPFQLVSSKALSTTNQ